MALAAKSQKPQAGFVAANLQETLERTGARLWLFEAGKNRGNVHFRQ